MSKKGKLYISVRIKRHHEVLNINGIGVKEAKNIVIFTVIGLALGIMVALIYMNPIYLFVIITLFSGGSYIFLKKDEMNRNTIDKLRLSREFSKSQKRFYYKYHNIHEKVKETYEKSRSEEINGK